MSAQETILEQVIRQAQHFILQLRTMFVLDTMARELRDPLIHCHWATINSPTRTSVKVCFIFMSGFYIIELNDDVSLKITNMMTFLMLLKDAQS